jgi:uncharacterized membrane protein
MFFVHKNLLLVFAVLRRTASTTPVLVIRRGLGHSRACLNASLALLAYRKPKEFAMNERNVVVAVYDTHTGAETAIKKLQRAGIDMHTLSIIGKDRHTDEHVVGYYNTGDRMKYWGKIGAFWGGFWGLLFGSAFFVIPGIGPLLAAGPIVGWIVGAAEGAAVVGGLSALGAGLYGSGIPKDSVLEYELALKTDKFLLMVHGSPADVERARGIIESTQPIGLKLHSKEKELVGVGIK